MIERAVGVMIAAPTPWTTRAASSAAGDQASPHIERRGREEQDTGHEQAPAPEQVGRPSSEQEQAAEGERVGAQHPLQALLGEAEVRLDRGQRHEHDRGVEEHHEEGAAEERKRPPAPGIGCIQHVASTSWCGRDQRVVARLHESSWVVVLDSCQRVVTVTCVDAPSHRPNGRPSGGGGLRSRCCCTAETRSARSSAGSSRARASREAASSSSAVRRGSGSRRCWRTRASERSDMRVLACAGVEAESALPFAALHQLLRPVLRHLEKVPRPQADALRGSAGLGSGSRGRSLSRLPGRPEPAGGGGGAAAAAVPRRRRALAGRRLCRRARVRGTAARGRGDRAAVRRPGRRSARVRCTRAGRATARRARCGCSCRAARSSRGHCALARDSRAAGRGDRRAPARLARAAFDAERGPARRWRAAPHAVARERPARACLPGARA